MNLLLTNKELDFQLPNQLFLLNVLQEHSLKHDDKHHFYKLKNHYEL